MMRIKTMLNDILTEKTGQPLDVVKNATERDNFMTPEEAVRFGLVDRVLTSRREMGNIDG